MNQDTIEREILDYSRYLRALVEHSFSYDTLKTLQAEIFFISNFVKRRLDERDFVRPVPKSSTKASVKTTKNFKIPV